MHNIHGKRPGRASTLSVRIGAGLATAGWGLLIWMFWQTLLVGFTFQIDPRLAMAWTALVTLIFLRVYAWGPRARRMRARLRVRGPGRTWKWLLATVPAMMVLPHALWVALLSFGLAREAPLPDMITKFAEKPYGELAFWILALAALPLVEEFAFRGWIQRPLERVMGADAAIAASALLFSLMHMQADAFPVRLAGGLVLGYAVFASRSLWAGLVLHAAWNAGVLAITLLEWPPDPTGKGWAWGGPAAAITLVAMVWCAWGVKKMQDDAGRPPLGGHAASGSPVASS
jgi:membrane protease YdiL (CAAX protease family)